MIGDGVDIDGLTACLDSCLLTAMSTDINEEKRDELLSELFGDRWEEWEEVERTTDGDEGHLHGPVYGISDYIWGRMWFEI